MDKEQYTFKIKPEIHKKLKLLSVVHDKPMGNMIEYLIYYFEQQKQKTEEN